MRVTVDARPFKHATRQYTRAVEDMIGAESKKSAETLAAKIRAVAPKDKGGIERSVEVAPVTGGFAVYVGGQSTTRKVGTRTYVMKSGRPRKGKPVDYAKIQEYGAPQMNIPAQPYINPARSKVRKAYNRRIRSRLTKIAKAHSG